MATHRVTYKWIERGDPEAHIGRTYFHVGDELEPTDKELEMYGDRLEPIEDADDSESGDQDSSDDNGGQQSELGENVESDDTGDADTLQGIDLESMSYSQLQELASNFDDIHGNLPKAEMRERLAAKQ